MNLAIQTIDGAADGPHLLILAGVHGDEFEPMAAVRRLVRLLRRNLPDRGRVTLVPVANPTARQRKERTGEDGLDLARTFPGRPDGTITERVACDLTELIRLADYMIDMHTGGARYRLWPLAGYLLHADASVLAEQRKMAQAFNLPVVWGTDSTVEGRSLSAARDAGTPAIYIEYLGAARFCRPAVTALMNGCMQTMAALQMVERPPAANQVRYWAEDVRPGAGHLQVSHPAPQAGRFVAAVKLGQQVAAGQFLGRLDGAVAMPSLEIFAQHRGRVVCLRSSTPVEAGEGLAVIVDFIAAEPQLLHDHE